MRNWKKIKAGKFIAFNPKESLKAGVIAKKIAMEKLGTFDKKIKGWEYAEYKGGPKFKNGDTLFARITPCLENGKTARVDILEEGEVAFGSTEFIVLRENDLSDSEFVYYLSTTPTFRRKAISCMEGTSGRKRVNEKALQEQIILVPDDLPTQRRIAAVLSALDAKIELNRRINAELEALAKTLYDYWFVQFDFPDANGKPYKSSGGKMVWSGELGREVPEGWEVKKLEDILILEYGKPLKEETRSGKGFPVLGSNGIVGYHNEFLVRGPGIVVGRKGTAGAVVWVENDFYPIDTAFFVKDKLGVSDLYYHHQLLNRLGLKHLESSSAVPGLNRNVAHSIQTLSPTFEGVVRFNGIVGPLYSKIMNNNSESHHLTTLRDWLLPLLMNGQVRVG